MGTLLRWQAERIPFVAALNLPQKRGGGVAASEHGVTGDALRVKAHKTAVMPIILIQNPFIDAHLNGFLREAALHQVLDYTLIIGMAFGKSKWFGFFRLRHCSRKWAVHGISA